MAKSNEDKSALFAFYWRLFAPEFAPPAAEHNFDKAIGRKHRFDWAFLEERIAVEVDGGSFAPGGGRHATDADREKLNIAASLRWLVFRFSPQQLKKDPAKCVEMVKRAIDDSR